MVSRRLLFGATIFCLLVGLLGVGIYLRQRIDRCAYVPLLAENLLPNAGLLPGDQAGMPAGWARAAGGVELRGPAIDGEGFVLDGDGRALQLIGIANYIQTPPIAVQPGRNYCFTGYALTDSEQGSATRLRVSFHWQDAQAQIIAEERSLWQPVVLWQPGNPPAGWSPLRVAVRAPPDADKLLVRIHPSSDDRVYLDAMRLRSGGSAIGNPQLVAGGGTSDSDNQFAPTIAPWPNGNRAALSFSFDWETAMGGLIHSRSVDDPYADEDPQQRGLRMRAGITTTLAIFRPYDIRATYYATGYNFLLGNTARVQFMHNPTYTWANQANRWSSDQWQTTPWFALDPYGTVQSHPAWYFGDLVPQLQQAEQSIQSHTFSHFYAGLVGPQDWQADIAAWNQVAAERGVPPMRSLAFPWSSSAGMSDAGWKILAAAGVTSVTRLSDQAQYNLFPQDADGMVLEPRCQSLPGHPQILACPDFYLTPESADRAMAQINRAREIGGMIDLWAHTEEVVTPEQQATWERLVRYAAGQSDLWIAPLPEIADWQQALDKVEVRIVKSERGTENPEDDVFVFTISNTSDQNLEGLTLTLPFAVERVVVDGHDRTAALRSQSSVHDALILDLSAGATIEVQAWPAA
jgi:hypothetical protein